MDLLGTARVAGDLGSSLRELLSSEQLNSPWLNDERSFEKHFGASFAHFASIVELLSPEQLSLYDRTVAVNPEAAVLWVLAMRVLGSG